MFLFMKILRQFFIEGIPRFHDLWKRGLHYTQSFGTWCVCVKLSGLGSPVASRPPTRHILLTKRSFQCAAIFLFWCCHRKWLGPQLRAGIG
jgi:hypothetical protein